METGNAETDRGPRQGRSSDDPFTQLVRKIVIHERRGMLRELARLAGLSYGAFYNRLNGRAEFNPREINMLLRQLDDWRLVDCLLDGTTFHVIRQQDLDAGGMNDDVLTVALACATDTLDAVRTTLDASRKGAVPGDDRARIDHMFLRIQIELQRLRELLTRGRPRERLSGGEAGQPGRDVVANSIQATPKPHRAGFRPRER
jgi:hypothetical protein